LEKGWYCVNLKGAGGGASTMFPGGEGGRIENGIFYVPYDGAIARIVIGRGGKGSILSSWDGAGHGSHLEIPELGIRFIAGGGCGWTVIGNDGDNKNVTNFIGLGYFNSFDLGGNNALTDASLSDMVILGRNNLDDFMGGGSPGGTPGSGLLNPGSDGTDGTGSLVKINTP
jgi:hypothetical protein